MKCLGLISNTFGYIILILIVSHYFLLVVDYEHFDLSNLDTPDKTNKRVPTKFQHEFSGRFVVEIIGIINKSFITLFVTLAKKSGLGKIKSIIVDQNNAIMVEEQRLLFEHRKQKIKKRCNNATKKEVFKYI